jgi:cobalt/nickel transport system permease protein
VARPLGAGAAAGAVGLNFLVLLMGGKDDWSTLAKLVLLAHVPIVVIEGLMLGVIVSYLEKVKPDLLASSPLPQDGKTSSNGTSH